MKLFHVFSGLLVIVSISYANADLDNDGVINELDYCENTEHNVIVDTTGCEPDDDRDGVVNRLDKCPNTPSGVKVDKDGCCLDSDNDGVCDYLDKCPNTPEGVPVDKDGCPLDSDQDGVLNPVDECPNTPLGYEVDEKGCATKFDLRTGFSLNSYELNEKGLKEVDTLYAFMKRNTTSKVVIEGHTCNLGGELYNKELSKNRAQTVSKVLKEKGIDAKRIVESWKGMAQPLASNETEERRALNRRVEIKIFYSKEDIEKEKLLP
ncbi:MAG: OmpA family protein [Campylobacterota bacterium]|nr:OmpA family protein [Campylobacterota bacterium]